MTQPRRLSRPDRPALDSHPRVRSGRPFLAQRDARPQSPSDGDRIDPGRLIETAFRHRWHADDPETYVLAWLALVRTHTDASFAAAALKARLTHLRIGPLSHRQCRILELLAFAARHVRRGSVHAVPCNNPLSKKGMS
jgi:hypothetical protein